MGFRQLSTSPLHPIQMHLFILIQLLLLFGDSFSKYHIVGPIYLYDVLLIGLSFAAIYYLVRERKVPDIYAIWIILVLSVIYLVISYLQGNPMTYMVRQYAMFVYLGISFLLVFTFSQSNFLQLSTSFLKVLALSALVIQLGYFVYKIAFLGITNFFDGFHYFSKMGIAAIIMVCPLALVYVNSIWKKCLFVAVILLICTMLGHSSAFLSAFVTVLIFLILGTKRRFKIVGIVGLIVSVAMMIKFLPQFSDNNATWRVVYWQYTLKDLLYHDFLLFGHGFGVPYVSDELLKVFTDLINSPWFDVRPEEQYTAPMHNSFLTMGFHIGLVPMLILFVPLKNAFRYFLSNRQRNADRDGDFLLLSLLGLSIWCSFNVVLELPHSSLLYWFVFFSVYFHFRRSKNEKTA